MTAKEVKLPSGAILRINVAPFRDAKNLYQAMLRELQSVPVNSQMEIGDLYKSLFCLGLSSPEIERCLEVCFKRCAYKPASAASDFLKIDEDTFEPVDRRDDYLKVCVEVARENVGPFAKSLFAEFKHVMQTMQSTPA